MFAKLALRNVRRQIRNYLIYFVTVALSIALLFAVNNLSYSDRVRALTEISSDMSSMFNMVTTLSCLVTALVLSYATGFMLKLRKKEFGLYLTLGMTRRNIRTLFACETGLLSGLALVVGMGVGLVIYQMLMALFSSIMEMPFAFSAYSLQGIALTLAVSIGLFLLSTLASLRYLKKVTLAELLKEQAPEQSEKHPLLWSVLSVLSVAGLAGSLTITYRSLMAAFHGDDSVALLLWLVVDLAMVFLVHFTLARTLAGLLLRSSSLKNRGTNTVVLRSLSGKMTVNSVLIGALSTLLAFAIVMSNLSLAEKVYSDYSLQKDCPYDVMAMLDLSEEPQISMEEGRQIIARYSPIVAQTDFELRSLGETTLCSRLPGYDLMGWTDKYMSLSQFNTLLAGCGYEPVQLENEYLMVTAVPELCDVDYSDRTVTLNGITFHWAGSSTSYPEFARRAWMYYVVPDEAVYGMPVSDTCAAYTLENSRIDALALLKELTYVRETPDGPKERCSFAIREEYRLYNHSTAGTLIICTLYAATVFVCMALAILSVKTLSTLEDERRRFAALYRLGADAAMQKAALGKQICAFFLTPVLLPLLATVPIGLVFGEIYRLWGFSGLSGQRAMETAVLISAVVACVFVLYFLITYRIACSHVLCSGGEKPEPDF